MIDTNNTQHSALSTQHSPAWRLIDSGPLDGATNMAVDEALLQSCIAGNPGFPTLRLFAWREPTLSIGIMQEVESDVDIDALMKLHIPLVRRPTGGRAVLHEFELTYSIVGSERDSLLCGNVVESYRKISDALVAAMDCLGLHAELAPPGSHHAANRRAASCFEQPADYEVSIGGRKLIGSAQARRHGCILQQGSILLGLDIDKLVSVLKFDSESSRELAAQRLGSRMTSVGEALGMHGPLDYAIMRDAIRYGFSEAMNLMLLESVLTVEEQGAAEQLRAEKYANDEWTLLR
jgi:lipoyl(octanoyl) transferase